MNLFSLIQIETIKTSRASSFWTALALFALFGSFFLWFSFQGTMTQNGQEIPAMSLPRDWVKLLDQFRGMEIIFVPISIILLTANEFTFKTARQNVIDGLSKESFFVSKIFCALALALIYFATAFILGLLFNAGSEKAAVDSAVENAKAFIGATELLALSANFTVLFGYAVIGLFFAFVTRASGSGIAFYVLYLVLEGLASGLLQFTTTFKNIVPYFPTKILDNLVKPLRFDAESFKQLQDQINQAKEAGRDIPDMIYSQFPLFETPAAFGVALAYIAVIGGATYLLFKNQDL